MDGRQVHDRRMAALRLCSQPIAHQFLVVQGTNAHVVLEAKMPDMDTQQGSSTGSILTDPNAACWQRGSFWFKPLAHPLLLSCSRAGGQGLPKMPQSIPTGSIMLHMQLDLGHPRLAFLGDHVIHGQAALPAAVAVEVRHIIHCQS